MLVTHREISMRGKVEVELNEALRRAETALRGYIDYVNGRVEHLNFESARWLAYRCIILGEKP